jgi:hypothetical protein
MGILEGLLSPTCELQRIGALNASGRLILMLTLGCYSTSGNAHVGADPSTPVAASARVTQREAVFVFQPDARARDPWPSDRLPHHWAGPSWRITLSFERPALIAALTVYPDSLRRLRAFASIDQAIGAAELAACVLDVWVLSCGTPLVGTAVVDRDQVVVRISDSVWLRRVHARRPTRAKLSVFGPRNEMLTDTLVIVEYAP